MQGKVWEERFATPLAAEVDALNRSAPFDWRLGPHDIQVSRVWSRALHRGGALTEADLQAILDGLDRIAEEWDAAGAGFLQPDDEDIHMGIERRLTELIGEPAERLHFGRSRNDMVATDMRLYIRAEAAALENAVRRLVKALADQADGHRETSFPGYTHLQQAQQVSLAHVLLAHASACRKDAQRLAQLAGSITECPLGAGALAGSAAPVDVAWIARELGFDAPAANSIEAVGSRDEVLDFLYLAARLGIHLSRLGEDVILWSSQEFGYATLGESSSTGSSQLPHKKNPDVFELARGKAARLTGNLTTVMGMLKGLPSGYNKDLQEDKEPLFDAVDTLQLLLPAMTLAVQELAFDPTRIEASLRPELKVEQVVGLLVERGLTFRQGYRLGQRLVKGAGERDLRVDQLSLKALLEISPEFDKQVQDILQGGWTVPGAGVSGGTSLKSVQAQLDDLRTWLGSPARNPPK